MEFSKNFKRGTGEVLSIESMDQDGFDKSNGFDLSLNYLLFSPG